MTAIAIHAARTRFNQRLVVEFTGDVREGETLALVGGNGAGKSTLLKGILDLHRFDEGRVEIFGIDNRLAEARRHLAYLPERFNPPHYLTGREFLRSMLGLSGLVYDEAKTLGVVAQLDLPREALDRPARHYSKGMAQKLGLAACLLSEKPLLILDEPMSGLDPLARARLKQLLQQRRARNQTVFFSSHQLAEVEELADRIAILHEGRLRFLGAPEECRNTFGVATLEQAYLRAIERG